jgi:hypothetical protein
MERQLTLLEPESPDAEWQLDEETKEIGLHGVALARAALQRARRQAVTSDRQHDAA